MSVQTIDRRLGHTRVDFTELVQLRSSPDHELWTHATNLSERGLHVRTDTVLAPGTPMDLVLPLPRTAQSLALRGRVAWSQDDRDGGMGIELVDLSEVDLSFLRREVMEGRPREWRRQVKVWFEGTREPTRAIAIGIGPSLQLVSDLGFLKLGSQVVVYGEAGADPLVGNLSEVALRRAGSVPQLVISVQSAAQVPGSPPPDETWTHWPPPPVRNIAVETDEIIIEEAPWPGGEVHVLESSGLTVAGSIEAHARPEPELAPEPTVETGATSEGWELGALVPDASDWQLRGPAVTLQLPRVRRRRRRLWLWWLAAALMAGTTVASMSYTHSWIRVRDRLQAFLGELGLQLAPRSTELLLSRPRILATDPVPVPVVVPTRPTAATRPAAPFVDEASRRLSIPLRGSIRESRSYPLASPAGLAINLPHAEPLTDYGDFEIQKAGFRSVWVRRRAGGLHIRVFFGPSLRPTLSLEAEQLSVQLSEGPTP